MAYVDGFVLAVKKEHQGKVKSAADLKGMKIGVTAPGSSTNFFVNYLIAKAGGNYKDAAFIGVGGGASGVAAIQKGEIDAACFFLTQAYVFALSAGAPQADALRARLQAHGREE